mmetsp:Transcript_81155/g.225856  ORF Transcript_81155/g.225856 Transcript_81155/m.225856 type:complete len:854 (+) Transcript_81155:95-2656(+)
MALVTSPPVAMRHAADDAVVQFQRRLAQESNDRDNAKIMLHRLKTAVDFSRQRLQGLLVRPAGLGSDDGSFLQRARDLVRDMDADVRADALDGSATHRLGAIVGAAPVVSPTKGKSYDVLRQSLEETQRRCENLNTDMVHQAEANSELVETLGTAKDTNRRLLEQIRQQHNEIAKMTQQRVADEEKADQITRMHECDRDAARQEAQRQVISVRDANAERHNQVYQQLTDKLRYVKARSEIMLQDVARLSRELEERRADAGNLVNTVKAHLQTAERDLSTQCDAPRKLHEQWKQASEDSIADLNARLASEREARHADGQSWGYKYANVGVDKEDVQARTTRELDQFTSRLQALERSLQSERQAWSEDRASLEVQAEEYLQQRNSRKSELDKLQRSIVTMESGFSATTSESAGLEETLVELKRQIRESNDALSAALSGNEHLRDQMEEQRAHLQDCNERDLNDCRAAYEQRISDTQVAHEADIAMAAKQLDAMEIDLRAQDEEYSKLKAQSEAVADECAVFDREVAMWRTQCDAAKSSREVQEKELVNSKRCYHESRLKLQAGTDQMTGHTSACDGEIKTLIAEVHDLRRTTTARETERTTRLEASRHMLKEKEDTLNDLRSRLRDASAEHARIGGEASGLRERMLDMHMSLEQNMSAQSRQLEDERRRMSETLNTQRRAAQDVRDEFYRERDTVAQELRRVHDDSRSKLAGVERERTRIQEISRADIGQASQLVSQHQHQARIFEHDLARVHTLLAESESNLSWVRQEQQSQEREAMVALRQLEEDVRAVSSAVEVARREEAQLTVQIESLRQRGEQERSNLRRSLGDLGSANTLKGSANVTSLMARHVPMTAR